MSYMYDVILFLLKLAMFVGAAVAAVTSVELPVNNNTTNAVITSVQIMLCSAIFFLYRMCAELLSAVRERRSYDAVADAADDAVFVVESDSDADDSNDEAGEYKRAERERQRDVAARAALDALDVAAEPVSSPPVVFGSIAELREHILLVHMTGFLVWHTVLALDYTQPALAYSFTCGIVAAWLSQVSRRAFACSHARVFCALGPAW